MGATRLIQGICLCLCSVLPLPSQAGKIAVAEAIEGVTSVDAEALIELAQHHPNLSIVDARQRGDRRKATSRIR